MPPPSPTPTCPQCGRSMRLKEARRGAHAGKKFWSCSGYPDNCKATLEVDGAGRSAPTGEPKFRRRVPWSDGACARPGWVCRYATAGATLRASRALDPAARRNALCWIARTDTPHTASLGDAESNALHVFEKILQRGTAPPIDPRSETRLLKAYGLGDRTQPAPLPGDCSLRLRPDFDVPPANALLQDDAAASPLDPNLPYDSAEERRFHTEWLPRRLGSVAPQWFIPQAPLESLVRARGHEVSGARRVDFLVVAPWLKPFVVEIDGQQHDSQTALDDDRDEELTGAGYDIVRIPVAELRQGSGPNLEDIRARWAAPPAPLPRDQSDLLVRAAGIHRFSLAIVEALRSGFLFASPWRIEIVSPSRVDAEELIPYFDLFWAINRLSGASLAPTHIEISSGATWANLALGPDGYLPENGAEHSDTPQVRIHLQPEFPPLAPLPTDRSSPAVVIRTAHLPVEPIEPPSVEARVLQPERNPSELKPALAVVLTAVFAKENFREGQLDALTEILAGRDCAVLLPTGAGKSLIYQLAGLVLPGSALIIDPLVALMEDQAEGLREYGIDRVTTISGFQTKQGLLSSELNRIASGESLFTFVAPERLQQLTFRKALKAQVQINPINLAVIDEAHCVSEWGHDFRPAYLNLGRLLREYCADAGGSPPPLLALTGTASRAVLRDVLIELEVDRGSERSVVRPRTFDRKELQFHIAVTTPQLCEGVLSGMLGQLPKRFNLPLGTFFSPRGDGTCSGIVFCPHVNGEHGLDGVARHIQDVIGRPPARYAGGAPKNFSGDWDLSKRKAARDFKDNREPVLVSTKAFGMGIDKPNIRYVIHYGIPTSIEGYYQEVGRAGRDRQHAACGLILIDFDERRSRILLDDTRPLEAMRQEREAIRKADQDDVTRQLWFHLKAFRGVDAEISALSSLLDEVGSLNVAQSVDVPMPDDNKERERAIHRLVVLGVLRDYTVDWGSRSFRLIIQHATSTQVIEHLCRYIRRYQPARVKSIRERVEHAASVPLRDAVIECGRELIGFIYDTVERSRRRSLREIWLAAREGARDPNTEFRRRILDYLTQGDIAPALEALIDRDRFEPQGWLDLLAEVRDPEDARELRGNAARLLSSYPDHPGLLLGRALSEAVDPTGDVRELASNLRMALASATERYGVSEQALGALVDGLLRLTAEYRSSASTAVVAVADSLSLATETVRETLTRAARGEAEDAGLGILGLARRLEATERALEAILDDCMRSKHGR